MRKTGNEVMYLDDYEPLTDEEIRVFIAGARWRDAQPNTVVPPHSYNHRDWNPEPRTFRRVVAEIHRRGYKGPFMKRLYTYLDIDGYTYWTMGWPVIETFILNRRRTEEM